MKIDRPSPAGTIGAIIAQAIPVPTDDKETNAERRLARRIDQKKALK